MSECVICGEECAGECCSGACRAKKSRLSRTVAPPMRTRTVAHAEALQKGMTTTQAPVVPGPDEIAKMSAVIQSKIDAHKQPILTQSMLDSLPDGVSRPIGQPTAKTAKMTAQQLQTRIRYYHGLDWVASKEYAEVIHRLLTKSIEELDAEGQFVPAWKKVA